jgi:DNA-binding transcriptional regulator YhcF (GntR family)
MTVTIDGASSVPPYEQVRSQLAAQITDGRLAAGTRLPPVRRLAEDLGLAANTVARTYRELESAGMVETRGRGGTVVGARGDDAREELIDGARQYASLARDLGISAEEALRVAAAALEGSRH